MALRQLARRRLRSARSFATAAPSIARVDAATATPADFDYTRPAIVANADVGEIGSWTMGNLSAALGGASLFDKESGERLPPQHILSTDLAYGFEFLGHGDCAEGDLPHHAKLLAAISPPSLFAADLWRLGANGDAHADLERPQVMPVVVLLVVLLLVVVLLVVVLLVVLLLVAQLLVLMSSSFSAAPLAAARRGWERQQPALRPERHLRLELFRRWPQALGVVPAERRVTLRRALRGAGARGVGRSTARRGSRVGGGVLLVAGCPRAGQARAAGGWAS